MTHYEAPGISISEEAIVAAWSKHYHLSVTEIINKDRHADVVIPRQVLMYCYREFTKLSLTQIGDRFGRDHCTVLNAMRKVKDTYMNDRRERTRLLALLSELNETAGKIKYDRIVVEITRDDVYRLMPDLTDEDKTETLRVLWNRYKKSCEK